ncbi:SOS response-associated peptidase [Trichococcus alkaliphilus]|uniref:SOS response-associated peptidase n=1 Tax=Trichococcus alkaliphilus TaxID=2052943 RepID=UPI001374F734|nr:SOS response-associated peptidase [Trichococcus alkaliphilus]
MYNGPSFSIIGIKESHRKGDGIMCGRYALEATKRELWERYLLGEMEEDIEERAEIFPTNTTPLIMPGNELVHHRWGFMEPFAKRPLINARAETILEKPTFSQPFRTARCLVPATAFFEWEKVGEEKLKRKITVSDIPIFSMAGILKTYHDENGKPFSAFSIITTAANEQMRAIHDRMPVILEPEDEAFYLDQKADPRLVWKLLKPTEHRLLIH